MFIFNISTFSLYMLYFILILFILIILIFSLIYFRFYFLEACSRDFINNY